MRKLLAVVFSAFALVAFSALAAPDAAKVKYGVSVPTSAYSMPSVMPPTVAVESQMITFDAMYKPFKTVAGQEAKSRSGSGFVAMFNQTAKSPEPNLRL